MQTPASLTESNVIKLTEVAKANQPQAPSPRGLSAKLTEGVAKVGHKLSLDCIGEGKTSAIPSTAQSKYPLLPTFDTPSTASRSPSLGEGGRSLQDLFALNLNDITF